MRFAMVMAAAEFIPVYDTREVERLLQLWVDGSLDGIQSSGKPAIGLEGCDIRSRGLVAQNLIERTCSVDVQRAIKGMIDAGGETAVYAEFMGWHLINRVPLQTLSQVYGIDCFAAQTWLIRAQDEFVSRLLKRN
ncbi:MAG TPA: hypothetical protein V6C46_10420 [Coleofasciculaceae cyanobacterium]